MSAEANQTTQNMAILVQVKQVYGVKTVYPTCPKAKAFAAIANTKTLTPQTISAIKALGYSIHVKPEEI